MFKFFWLKKKEKEGNFLEWNDQQESIILK
jgi:hypothetical protein